MSSSSTRSRRPSDTPKARASASSADRLTFQRPCGTLLLEAEAFWKLNLGAHLRPLFFDASGHLFVEQPDDLCGEMAGVACPHRADRDGGDGNARRHLDDGEE